MAPLFHFHHSRVQLLFLQVNLKSRFPAAIAKTRYEWRKLKYFCIHKLRSVTVRCGYRVECCDFQRHNIKIELAAKFDFEHPQKELDKNGIFRYVSAQRLSKLFGLLRLYLTFCVQIYRLMENGTFVRFKTKRQSISQSSDEEQMSQQKQRARRSIL